MGSRRSMAAPFRRLSVSKHEALHEALRTEPAACLKGMVRKALALFEAGADPDEAYAGFDIESFAGLLAAGPAGAALALACFQGRPIEERLAASMFVSMAIIAVDNTDQRLSRIILEHVGSDPSLDKEMSDMVLVFIAQTVHDMPAQSTSLSSLAGFCMSRLSH